MIDLSRAQFKPLVIFVSLFFIPAIVGLVFAIVKSFLVAKLIWLLVFIIAFIGVILMIYKSSHSKKYTLSINNGFLTAVCQPPIGNLTELTVKYEDIIELEYYRMRSILSWIILPLSSFCVPRCVEIAFRENGNEVAQWLGYMTYDEVKRVAAATGSKLKVH